MKVNWELPIKAIHELHISQYYDAVLLDDNYNGYKLVKIKYENASDLVSCRDDGSCFNMQRMPAGFKISNKTIKREGWTNVFSNFGGSKVSGIEIFKTEEDAKKNANLNPKYYIATAKIECEEVLK